MTHTKWSLVLTWVDLSIYRAKATRIMTKPRTYFPLWLWGHWVSTILPFKDMQSQTQGNHTGVHIGSLRQSLSPSVIHWTTKAVFRFTPLSANWGAGWLTTQLGKLLEAWYSSWLGHIPMHPLCAHKDVRSCGRVSTSPDITHTWSRGSQGFSVKCESISCFPLYDHCRKKLEMSPGAEWIAVTDRMKGSQDNKGSQFLEWYL